MDRHGRGQAGLLTPQHGQALILLGVFFSTEQFRANIQKSLASLDQAMYSPWKCAWNSSFDLKSRSQKSVIFIMIIWTLEWAYWWTY